jgi:hypothetical protein
MLFVVDVVFAFLSPAVLFCYSNLNPGLPHRDLIPPEQRLPAGPLSCVSIAPVSNESPVWEFLFFFSSCE